jgi:serine/threonine protein phosphatase PrpC
MSQQLTIAIGQFSEKGCKPTNQDFHGALIPGEPLLSLKGIAVALADGISSSKVSAIASESAVKGFLTDYYCTSEAWSVKTSARRVIAATNSWLYAQTRRSRHIHDPEGGYVCTFSAIVFKSTTAHLFHIGDARIYRLSGDALDQLTEDHRLALSAEQTYLSRALGINPQIEIDYQAVPLSVGDVFVLMTDGAYEHVGARWVVRALNENSDDLDRAAQVVAAEAVRRGSTDNITVQIVRIDSLPDGEAREVFEGTSGLPLPPQLEPRMTFEGYRILRQLHASSRSHVHLAADSETGALVVIKTPSIDLRSDPDYLKRFMMEEWVARRIASAHVLKPCSTSRKRHYLYTATEFVDGQTLSQWMIDNPGPDLETVRGLVEQIAKGLRAFHRLEMLHQDLRPDNIMIDKDGTVKIIDFGSASVRGVAEAAPAALGGDGLGTHQYTAPEYFLGERGCEQSDLYSLGVITYQMLTGRLPYGAEMAKARTRAQQRRLRYRSVLDDHRDIPAWIDGVLRRAVHPDPGKRQEALSEFTHDLRHPSPRYMTEAIPLIERNPALFWKALSLALACANLIMLTYVLSTRH